jgi:Domain of unknown function (DUF222)
MFDQLVSMRGQLAELVSAVDPDALSGQTARGWWAEFDRVERLAAAGKTLLARRVAATHRPAQRGTKSAAEELAQKGGTTTGTAKDSVNTSERLVDQPGVEGALRRGELSPAQAAAISAAVAANPAEEDRLIALAARVSLVELREECARVRAAADPDPEATHRRIHAARQLRQWVDGEGFWNLHAKGTPAAGAIFGTALRPIIDQLFKDAYRAGRREPVEAYAFDALIHLAQHATGACTCTHSPNDDGVAGAAGTNAEAPDGPAGKDGTDEAGVAGQVADAPAGGGVQNGSGEAGVAGQVADAPAGGGVQNGSDEAGAPGMDTAAVRSADSGGTNGADEGPMPGNPSRPDSVDSSQPGVPGGPATPVSGLSGVPGDTGIFAAGRSSTGPSCGVPAKASTNPRYLALLRVDVEALRRGQAQPGELCEIAGVGPVPVSVARDVLGDAIVKLVITDGVDVLNVTHLGRGPTAAQRAALLWINPACSVLGCLRTRIEIDHQKPWADTHHTRLDELDGLCAFHHDLKTRVGYALVAGSGKRAFVAPDDPRHPRHQANPQAAGRSGLRRPAAADAVAGSARSSASRARRRRSRPGQPTLPDPPGDPPRAA